MARKDRERARKRRAIDRARREAGWEPAPKDDDRDEGRDRNARRRDRRPPPGPRRAAPLRRMRAGEVDSRGRKYTRSQFLDPRLVLLVSLLVVAGGVVAWTQEEVGIAYLFLAVGIVVMADSQPTWPRVSLMLLVAVMGLGSGILALVSGV